VNFWISARVNLSLNKVFAVFSAVFLLGSIDLKGAEIIPADRRVEWRGNVGVVGGIPNVTTVFRSFPDPATRAQVQAALESCPSNQVVLLGPWTNTWTETLDWQGVGDGVVLRGTVDDKGFPRTKIVASTAKILLRAGFDSSFTSANLSVDAQKGARTITLSTVPSWVKTGHLIGIDQADDPALSTTSGQEGVDQYRPGRGMNQLCKVVSVSGGTITVEVPLYYGFKVSRAAQIFQPGYNPATTSPIRRCGIEDLMWEHTGSATDTHMIKLESADQCWVKNFVGANLAGGIYVFANFSYRCEVRHSRFDNSKQLGGGQGYGVALYHFSCGWLVEDNIFTRLHVSMQNNYGSSGNVFAYNFQTDGQSTSGQNPGINAHGSTGYQILWEGNYLMDKVNGDYVHGGSLWNTVFRNRVLGKNPRQSNNQAAISIEMWNRHWNVVGNVLGDASYHTGYDAGYGGTGYSTADCSDASAFIYFLGFWSNWGCDTSNGDNYSVLNILRAVNYDVVTKGIVLGGFQNTDLVDSYYLSGKPAWFGDRPWPPFDPRSPQTAVATNLPAGYRYVFGQDPTTGPQNQAPLVVANANPLSGLAPLQVSFSSVGTSDPEGASLTYDWDFGDGTAHASQLNPVHSYTSDGSYVAVLRVSDGVQWSTSAGINITVGNQPPIASAAASGRSGPAPLSVSFSSSGSSDPEGRPLQYSWNFGDGSSSTSANPSHSFTGVGQYNVQLTVSDGTKSSQAAPIAISVLDPSGLVASFAFDEGSGGSVSDSSGNGNNGTIAAASWGAGKFGSALIFNGTSSMVTIPDSPSLDLTTGMTLEAWVNPATLGGWRDIIYKGPFDKYVLLGSTPQAQTPGAGGTFNGSALTGTGALPLNTWSHLAATYDRSVLRLYVNGVQVASRAVTAAIEVSDGPMTIGGDLDYGQYWQGAIDNVRIYNRALTAAEIQTNMGSGSGAQRPSPPQNLRVVVE
jgi:PKD repeat protein